MLTEVTAVRYVTPLREGGSLPGAVEADGRGTYRTYATEELLTEVVADVPDAGLAQEAGFDGTDARRCRAAVFAG